MTNNSCKDEPDAQTRDPIIIVFATDNNYSQHLAVTLVSLIENNENEALDLYVILLDVDANHQASLRSLTANKPRVSLTFINFDYRVYSHFPISQHFTWSTYARIFIPQVLGPTITKALYLDCDLYIADSIRPLWETDLGTSALAAVPLHIAKSHMAVLGIPEGGVYYNAGVLLLNLDVWRRDSLTEKLVEYITNHSQILKWHDQDALNGFLHDRIRPLDTRWNVNHTIFEESAERLKLTPQEHALLKQKPGIVHFTSDKKPWCLLNNHPYRDHYWRILKTTPYRNYRPSLLSARMALPFHYRPRTLMAQLQKKLSGVFKVKKNEG